MNGVFIHKCAEREAAYPKDARSRPLSIPGAEVWPC